MPRKPALDSTHAMLPATIVSADLLAAVDAYAARLPTLKTRSDAVRDLLYRGLSWRGDASSLDSGRQYVSGVTKDDAKILRAYLGRIGALPPAAKPGRKPGRKPEKRKS
jgi:hypothetical protein